MNFVGNKWIKKQLPKRPAKWLAKRLRIKYVLKSILEQKKNFSQPDIRSSADFCLDGLELSVIHIHCHFWHVIQCCHCLFANVNQNVLFLSASACLLCLMQNLFVLYFRWLEFYTESTETSVDFMNRTRTWWVWTLYQRSLISVPTNAIFGFKARYGTLDAEGPSFR